MPKRKRKHYRLRDVTTKFACIFLAIVAGLGLSTARAFALDETHLRGYSVIFDNDGGGAIYVAGNGKVYIVPFAMHDTDDEGGMVCPSLNSNCTPYGDLEAKIRFDGSTISFSIGNDLGETARISRKGGKFSCKSPDGPCRVWKGRAVGK